MAGSGIDRGHPFVARHAAQRFDHDRNVHDIDNSIITEPSSQNDPLSLALRFGRQDGA
ncbi:hypothetical protein ABIB82_003711 [Bradyrhizobium sp. i1.8.4]|uniref:hypothetical protein n=1 Tax=unclassified Bradyrhizobium TaxID=2631580 RepID=UPI003D217AFB